MLERVKRNGMVPEAVVAETREAVFNYFAGVIFDRLPADTQHACLTTALLPQVTARGAELVSGQPEAARLLEQLYRGRLFTDRRMVVAAGHGAYPGSDGLVATYQYHPLFRAFLLERGRQAWSPEVRQRWSLNAASLLEVSGQTLDAIAILVELAQWTRAAELIVAQAPKLIAQGRWQTLHAWLQGLPEAVLEQEPWLVYWWGISLLAVNQDDARKLLERAHRLMQAAGDAGGQLQAAAGVIDSHYYQWASFAEVDRWIVVIQALLEAKPVFDSVEAELHVYSSLLIAIAYREPANPMLPDCVARVAQLLDTDADVAQRVTAGTFLLGYCYFAGEYGLAQRAIATIEPLLAHADVTSLNRLWWRARVAHYAYNIADYPGALRALDEAVDISRNHGSAGLHSVEPLLAFFNALVALSGRDLAGARECVATLRRLANPRRRFDMWYLQFIESVMALLANDLSESLDLARTSIQSAVAIGMVYLHELSLTLTAHVLAQMGRYDDALQAAAGAKALVEGSVNRNMAAEAIFVEAHVAAQQGNLGKATALVQSAFRTSRDAHYLFWFRFMPTVLPEACSLALSMGIDCEYVTGVIHRYGIAPPRPYVKDWPWPLRISTLGPFSVVKAGGPIDLARTGTRKPMELLKAIIALGIEGVPVAALIDQLWPDAEGDAGQKALGITLHRLRKQLGDERAVVLKAGSVAIDQRVCWVDVSAFERVAREEVTFEDRARAAAAASDLEALYRGSFLSAELSQPWILGAPPAVAHAIPCDRGAAGRGAGRPWRPRTRRGALSSCPRHRQLCRADLPAPHAPLPEERQPSPKWTRSTAAAATPSRRRASRGRRWKPRRSIGHRGGQSCAEVPSASPRACKPGCIRFVGAALVESVLPSWILPANHGRCLSREAPCGAARSERVRPPAGVAVHTYWRPSCKRGLPSWFRGCPQRSSAGQRTPSNCRSPAPS